MNINEGASELCIPSKTQVHLSERHVTDQDQLHPHILLQGMTSQNHQSTDENYWETLNTRRRRRRFRIDS